MRKAAGANHSSNSKMVIGPTELTLGLRECEEANSRSNMVWLPCKIFQRVSCNPYHLMVVVLPIAQLRSGFKGVIPYFNNLNMT